MIIAIIGTHSTGKTTLIRHLEEALNIKGISTALVPELARECPFPINENSTLEAQQWILHEQIRREQILEKTADIVICDRASIDNFAYLERAAALRLSCIVHSLEKLAVEHTTNYTHLFKTSLLPLPPEKDDARSINTSFRDEMEDRISKLLTRHAIHYHKLAKTTDYQTHTKYIIDILVPH